MDDPSGAPTEPAGSAASADPAPTTRAVASQQQDPLRSAGTGALAAAVVVAAGVAYLLWQGHDTTWIPRLLAVLAGAGILRMVLASARIIPTTDRAPLGSSRYADGARIAAVVILTALVAGVVLYPSWNLYRTYAVGSPILVLVCVTVTLGGLSRLAFLVRRILWERKIPAAPTRRPLSGEPTPWTRLRRWTLTTLAACSPAVVTALIVAAVGASMPAPDRSLRAEQTLADAVGQDTLPAVPTGAPAKSTWHTTIMGKTRTMAMVAGVRGPVIMTNQGVQALNGDDGAILWTYQAPDRRCLRAFRTPVNLAIAPCLLVSSPDRRHVALAVVDEDPRFKEFRAVTVVILDTMTGQVTAQHQSPPLTPEEQQESTSFLMEAPVQLTDSAALIGTDVISLADSAVIGQLEPSGTGPGSPGTLHGVYGGTAGHSTFLLPGPASDDGAPTLTLVPDSNFDARVPLEGVCTDPFAHDQPVIQDGWTATCDPLGDPAHAPTPWTMTAVNIDEVAAAGSAQSVQQVQLGEGMGVNSVTSAASGTLITLPFRPGAGGTPSFSTSPPWAGTVLEQATRTAVPAEQSTSIGAATLTYTTPSSDVPDGGSELVISPGGGAAPLSIPVAPPLVCSAPASDEQQHGLVSHHTSARWEPQVLTAPGCIVLAISSSDPAETETIIYAVR